MLRTLKPFSGSMAGNLSSLIRGCGRSSERQRDLCSNRELGVRGYGGEGGHSLESLSFTWQVYRMRTKSPLWAERSYLCPWSSL